MNKNQTDPTIPLQRCVECFALTGRCEDDELSSIDGPLCEACWDIASSANYITESDLLENNE